MKKAFIIFYLLLSAILLAVSVPVYSQFVAPCKRSMCPPLIVPNTAMNNTIACAINCLQYRLDSLAGDTTGGNVDTANFWNVRGNTGTVEANNFIGTTDLRGLITRTNNLERMRVTSAGLVGIGTATPGAKTEIKTTDSTISSFSFLIRNGQDSVTFGVYDNGVIKAGMPSSAIRSKNLIMGTGGTLIGDSADHNSIFGIGAGDSLVNGERLTLIGFGAGNKIRGFGSGGGGTNGYENSFGGYLSGFACSTCFENSAWGAFSLTSITSGQTNTAVGLSALEQTTTGSVNTAIGANALRGNTTGNNNVGVGNSAGQSNTTGERNTFVGYLPGLAHVSGDDNVMIGSVPGEFSTGGARNVFIGYHPGDNTTGNFNVLIGANAGRYGNYSNTVLFNTLDRSTTAKELTHSPIIVTQHSDSSQQDGLFNFNQRTQGNISPVTTSVYDLGRVNLCWDTAYIKTVTACSNVNMVTDTLIVKGIVYAEDFVTKNESSALRRQVKKLKKEQAILMDEIAEIKKQLNKN